MAHLDNDSKKASLFAFRTLRLSIRRLAVIDRLGAATASAPNAVIATQK
tara:strand:- start:3945 stop:4091 length:147 start_codon:yes stop_codon:yes gene_type:complete